MYHSKRRLWLLYPLWLWKLNVGPINSSVFDLEFQPINYLPPLNILLPYLLKHRMIDPIQLFNPVIKKNNWDYTSYIWILPLGSGRLVSQLHNCEKNLENEATIVDCPLAMSCLTFVLYWFSFSPCTFNSLFELSFSRVTCSTLDWSASTCFGCRSSWLSRCRRATLF